MSLYDQEMQKLQSLRSQVAQIEGIVNSKSKNLQLQQSLLSQQQIPSVHPRDMEKNLARNLGPILAPGNVGDINKIVWPYYFTTDIPTEPLLAGQSFSTSFRVTQEAAFIFMSFMKAIYINNDALSQWVYLDPNDESNLINQAPGLTFTFRDGSSTRQLFNTPMNVSSYGNPRFPTKFPRPVMLLPNQEMEIVFTNNHPNNEYIPFMTSFGYRMRVEDAQQFLGLVYG